VCRIVPVKHRRRVPGGERGAVARSIIGIGCLRARNAGIGYQAIQSIVSVGAGALRRVNGRKVADGIVAIPCRAAYAVSSALLVLPRLGQPPQRIVRQRGAQRAGADVHAQGRQLPRGFIGVGRLPERTGDPLELTKVAVIVAGALTLGGEHLLHLPHTVIDVTDPATAAVTNVCHHHRTARGIALDDARPALAAQRGDPVRPVIGDAPGLPAGIRQGQRAPEGIVVDSDGITTSVGARQQLALIAIDQGRAAPQRVGEAGDAPGIVIGIRPGAARRVSEHDQVATGIVGILRLAAQGVGLTHDAPHSVIGHGARAPQGVGEADQPARLIVDDLHHAAGRVLDAGQLAQHVIGVADHPCLRAARRISLAVPVPDHCRRLAIGLGVIVITVVPAQAALLCADPPALRIIPPDEGRLTVSRP